MRKLIAALFLVALGAVQAQAAGTIDLDLNDESVQARFTVPLVLYDQGSSEFNGRVLYNDDEDLTLGSMGLDFLGQPAQVPGLTLGVGAEVLGGEKEDPVKDQNFLSLAAGARLSYNPPVLSALGFHAHIFYAPKVLSFLDTNRVRETAVRVSYTIIPQADIFLEYQNVHMDFEDIGDHTVDDELRIGFLGRF
ncbi:MAG: YfaZ family outer membrane protein [Deltaproteobacteria bacterium]